MSAEEWPVPCIEEGSQPHFLFIITPPYSGSTALVELLNTSHKTMVLHPRGEGQWLIPGLCKNDRWSQSKEINRESIKAVWLHKFHTTQQLTKNIEVVIEKSPPNMMRLEEIASLFHHYSLLANNRNPYANCASILYSNYSIDDVANSGKRAIILKELAENWATRSIIIDRLKETHSIPLVTYEEFCERPSRVLSKLRLPGDVAETINWHADVKVKNYPPQKIINQNKRQISKLTDEDMVVISKVLGNYKDVMRRFKYDIL
jgi:hypothetical protein